MKKLFLLLLLFSTPAWATTRYVDGKTGAAPCTANSYSITNRSCTGSDGNSYATITLGLAATSAGDTLDVRGATSGFTGIYDENLQNLIPAGTSTSARTRLIGHTGETAEIKPTMACTRVITNNQRPYVEISHLTITGGSNVQYHAVQMGGNGTSPTAHHCLFTNNIVTNPGGDATTHTCLSMTDFIDNTNNTITNNTVSNCSSPNYGPGSVGIYTTGSDTLIEGNTVTCNVTSMSGIRNGESNGSFNSSSTIIRNNKVSGACSVYSIGSIYAGNDRQIYNNIVYGTGAASGQGIRAQGYRAQIYNNTVWNVGSYGLFMDAITQGKHTIRNNIVYQCVTGNMGAIGQDNANATNASTYSNNLTTNPGFTSSGTGDFSLATGSAAIGTGFCTNISSSCTPEFASNFITTDYSGVTRANGTTTGSQIDIGALENATGTPSITVLTPIGGETWEIGTTQSITWSSINLGAHEVKITADLDGNGSYETTIDSSDPNDGIYSWTVSGSANANCKVKIEDQTDSAVFDVSDAVFATTATPITPTITIVYPASSDVYAKGSNVTISWTSTNLTGNVLIELSRNNGTTYETIGTYLYNATDVVYVATTPSSSTCKVRITSVNNGAVTATSSAFRLGGRIM